MKAQSSKVKVFCTTAFILTAAATLLYSLCHLLAGDGTDYFVQGHPLPLLANILSAVSALWFASALILIPKDVLPEDDFITETGKPYAAAVAPLIGVLAAGTITLTYYEASDLAGVLAGTRALDATLICALLAMAGAILSSIYYLFRLINTPKLNNTCVVLGIGPIALLTGLCGLTYFELDHHMNAPVKIGLQLAFIASMLFLICELRCSLDKSQPRRYLAFAGIALLANACASIPALVSLIGHSDAIHSMRISGFALLCLCNCIYAACRLIQFTRFCNIAAQTASPDIFPDPEQMQGKDDQDGCQQQDSMAS